MSDVELNPDPAAGAARATAATEPAWEGWASRSISALHDAASESRESVVSAAFSSFAEELTPQLRTVASLVGQQASSLATAVDTAVDADMQSAGAQQPADAATSELSSVVSRPINVP